MMVNRNQCLSHAFGPQSFEQFPHVTVNKCLEFSITKYEQHASETCGFPIQTKRNSPYKKHHFPSTKHWKKTAFCLPDCRRPCRPRQAYAAGLLACRLDTAGAAGDETNWIGLDKNWDVSPFFPRKFGRNISCVCQKSTEKHVWGFRQPGSRTKALPPKTIPDLTAWIPWGKVKIIITAVDRYKPLQLDLYVDYTLWYHYNIYSNCCVYNYIYTPHCTIQIVRGLN